MSTISSDQALRIRGWLVDHGFHPDEAQESGSERWIYGDRLVRLTLHGERARVDIRHGAGSGWQELSELEKLRTGWPEASTMSPIELATAPQLHPHRDRLTFRRAPGRWFYERGQPWAHGVKVLLQMIVGVGAVIDIGRHVVHSVTSRTASSPLAFLIRRYLLREDEE